jgi:predicted MFS family arabinose efflux permease
VLFVFAERRASEAVLPLSLFRNRAFVTTVTLGAIVGFAMFGTVTYMPVFLQVVTGATPTGSGLLMVPMMGGMLFTSILSGQLISRTGRYKMFPMVGTLIMSVGLFLLSRMTAHTTRAEATRDMLVLGLGMGLIMQVLVLAVQNAGPSSSSRSWSRRSGCRWHSSSRRCRCAPPLPRMPPAWATK